MPRIETDPDPEEAAPHQFRLWAQRRYAPFFWTMFLGALNDNLLKFVIVLVLTYQVQVDWLPPAQVGPVLGGLFILPSVLWSVLAGEIADRFDLDALMRWGKTAELAMMGLAAWSLWQQSVPGMLLCVLASGAHVTLFATLKYAYPPRHLAAHELVGGNGLLEMGTFSAILLGTVLGGLCMSAVVRGEGDTVALGQGPVPWLLGVALVGWWCARRVPHTPAAAPHLRVSPELWASSVRTFSELRKQPELWWSALGISWMWAFGSVMFSLFPAVARDVLHADPDVAASLLVVSTLGVALGALACEGLSRQGAGQVPDLGLVLLGGVMMGFFGLDLARVVGDIAADPGMRLVQHYGLTDLRAHPSHWMGLVDLALMSVGIAWFSVPWYAQMQARADDERRARVVGANNLLNALFILLASVAVSALLSLGLDLGTVMGLMALAQLVWLAWACRRQPRVVTDALALCRRWGRPLR
jgi:Major Facilitator Superfamily